MKTLVAVIVIAAQCFAQPVLAGGCFVRHRFVRQRVVHHVVDQPVIQQQLFYPVGFPAQFGGFGHQALQQAQYGQIDRQMQRLQDQFQSLMDVQQQYAQYQQPQFAPQYQAQQYQTPAPQAYAQTYSQQSYQQAAPPTNGYATYQQQQQYAPQPSYEQPPQYQPQYAPQQYAQPIQAPQQCPDPQQCPQPPPATYAAPSYQQPQQFEQLPPPPQYQQGYAPQQQAPYVQQQYQQPLQSTTGQRCASCHTGQQSHAKASFDLNELRQMPFEDKVEVLKKVTAGEMPKDAPPLTDAEIGNFVRENFSPAEQAQLQQLPGPAKPEGEQ